MGCHLTIGLVKWASLYRSRYFWDKIYVFVVAVVYQQCYLGRRWIFMENLTAAQTHEQRSFELWLHIEYYMTASYILSAILFIFVRKMKKLTMLI